MSDQTFGTEAPVPMTDGGVPVLNPSGGVDEAKDAQVKAEADGEVPATVSAEATTADAGGTSEPAEGTTTAPKVVTPTPEEQAEIDAMVDYTITEETVGNFTPQPDGTTYKVGDVVKLPADNPLVAKPTEGGTPSV